MTDRLMFTVLVIGENHEEIIKKYSANNRTENELFLKYSDAEKFKNDRIDNDEYIIENSEKYGLSKEEIELRKKFVEILKTMSADEYFAEVTNGCEYDPVTHDAYYKYNPRAKYIDERCPQELLVMTGEETGFCTPFTLKEKDEDGDGLISYCCRKGEVDWDRMHKYNQHVYEITWDMIVEGMEPRTDAERIIYERFVNRKSYFDNFKSKEEYVLYNTSFWSFAVATEDSCVLCSENDTINWIINYYDHYIKDLPDDTLITLYEVKKIEKTDNGGF